MLTGENHVASIIGVLAGALLACSLWLLYPQFEGHRILLPTTRLDWAVVGVLFVLSASIAAARGGLLVCIVASWLPIFAIELYAYAYVYRNFVLLPFEPAVLVLAVIGLAGALPIGVAGFVVGISSRWAASHYAT